MINKTCTENGAIAYETTGNEFLDLFATIGSARGDVIPTYVKQFEECYKKNKNLALRLLLWTRDIRGGAGAREVFRQIVASMTEYDPKTVAAMVRAGVFEEFGRWDDILIPFQSKNPILNRIIADHINTALIAGNGLAAKWLPRQGEVAKKLRAYLQLSPKDWRTLLVHLTRVVEQKMCARDWESIDFEKITAKNLARYAEAFRRNTHKTWSEYKGKAVRGEAKVKADTVFPYDVIRTLLNGDEELADLQWKALPQFFPESVGGVLPVIDVSGSMEMKIGGSISAMMVSIGLGIYASERQSGEYKNRAITFAEHPSWIKIRGETLKKKYLSVRNSAVGYSTNLARVFDLLLKDAVEKKVPAENMPSTLLIISDMQFDYAVSGSNEVDLYEYARQSYRSNGYVLPRIVFWNVNARVPNTHPSINLDTGTALLSGFSPAVLKTCFKVLDVGISPLQIMLETLNVDRYSIQGLTK